ncbi:MAG: helix-turn-helix domain-containing protein [Clostridia bacterium]|nr:helix-turn-helix domain-containing protein [Clostridia bacterium]
MKKYFEHKLQNLINVSRIIAIHYFEFDRHFRTKKETHNFWEMVYVDKGSLICTANEETVPLSEWELLFHKPMEHHALAADGNETPRVYILCFSCRSEAMRFFDGKRLKADPTCIKMIYSLLSEGKKTFQIPISDPNSKKMEQLEHPSLGGEQMIKNYLEIFLISLLRAQTETERGNEIFLRQKDYARKPIRDVIEVLRGGIYRSLTIDDICAATSYGRAYLFRVFKAGTDQTIMEYYLSLKIERAKQLLVENELTVKEISSLLAFNEANYFSKTFKRVTGLTPTEYRQKQTDII